MNKARQLVFTHRLGTLNGIRRVLEAHWRVPSTRQLVKMTKKLVASPHPGTLNSVRRVPKARWRALMCELGMTSAGNFVVERK